MPSRSQRMLGQESTCRGTPQPAGAAESWRPPLNSLFHINSPNGGNRRNMKFVCPPDLPSFGFLLCVVIVQASSHRNIFVQKSMVLHVSSPLHLLSFLFLPLLPPARPLSTFPAIFMPCVTYMILCISVKSNYHRQEKICYSSF